MAGSTFDNAELAKTDGTQTKKHVQLNPQWPWM